MDAMELYALSSQMETAGVRDSNGQPLKGGDLFQVLEYLWACGVDLRPACSGRRLPAMPLVLP